MDNLNQGHGHVTKRLDGVKARCGGPGFCKVCQAEKAALERAVSPAERVPDLSKLNRFDMCRAFGDTASYLGLCEDGDYVCLADVQALLAQPLQQEDGDEVSEEMEDPILIPRGLIGAACYLIRKHAPESKLLGKLREYTTGSRSGYTAPQPSDNLQQASTVQADCTEPNRADCPRKCMDFCNKAEEAASTTDAGQAEQSLFLQQWYGGEFSGEWPEHFAHAFTGWRAARRTIPAQATPYGADLPALPETRYNGYSDGSEPLYTADQMRDYARAALAAATAAEPVAWRAEFIAEAAQQSGFTRSASCCSDPLKFCNGDEWEGNIEGFAKALLRLAAPPQQQEPICCNHNCNQGRDCPNR
jgi:hypothetical protein